MGTAEPPSYTYNQRKEQEKKKYDTNTLNVFARTQVRDRCAEGRACGWKGKGSKSLKSLKCFETVRFVNICDSFIQDKIVGDFIVCFATVQEKIC